MPKLNVAAWLVQLGLCVYIDFVSVLTMVGNSISPSLLPRVECAVFVSSSGLNDHIRFTVCS